MPPLRSVTVYCSSSSSVHGEYQHVARGVGEALAARGRRLVYGGGRLGLMGAVASACREHGGHVTGIITERLKTAELLDEANDENIVVATMRERKRLLAERGDAFVVLPGGVGTLEEFFEVLVGRLLGEHDKPIALLNCPDPVDDEPYYTPLLTMFEHMANNRFMNAGVMDLFHVCQTVEELATLLDRWEDERTAGPVSSGLARTDPDALLPGRLA